MSQQDLEDQSEPADPGALAGSPGLSPEAGSAERTAQLAEPVDEDQPAVPVEDEPRVPDKPAGTDLDGTIPAVTQPSADSGASTPGNVNDLRNDATADVPDAAVDVGAETEVNASDTAEIGPRQEAATAVGEPASTLSGSSTVPADLPTVQASNKVRESSGPSARIITVFNAGLLIAVGIVTNIATGEPNWFWWALLLTLAISAVALAWLLSPDDDRPTGGPWRRWTVLSVVTAGLTVAVVAVVVNILNPPDEGPPDGSSKIPVSVGEVLRRSVVGETDLDASWQRQKTPVGTKSITDDEFCGDKPGPRPSQQYAQVFSESFLGTPRAAIFSQSVFFQRESAAQAFMADVRRLAESCTQWPYTPAPNARAFAAKILSHENVDLGQDAYKIVVPGGGSETAYLYIRNGRYILSVTHDVLDLPLVTGDEYTDPAVLDELGRKVQERFEDATK